MGRRRCCCVLCEFFSDSFNRADSSDLGLNWSEGSGDWYIEDNKLCVDSANAKVTCLVATSGLPYSLRIQVRMYPQQETDQLWVGIDDKYYVVIDRGPDDGEWRLRVITGAAPPSGDIRSTMPVWQAIGPMPDHVDLEVTISSEWLSARTDAGAEYASIPVDPTDFTLGRVSLGTGDLVGGGTPSTARFDDFVLEVGYEEVDHCPAPTPNCKYVWGPELLPNGQTLDADDWTTAGDWTILDDKITFTGAGSVLTKAVHPYEPGPGGTPLNYFWLIRTTWNNTGVGFDDEIAYIYFGGLTNYVKLRFEGTPTGVNITAGVYIGGVLSGAEQGYTGAGNLEIDVCVSPSTVTVVPAGSGFHMTRVYTSGSNTFGVGSDDADVQVTSLAGYVTLDIQEGCPPCGLECMGCEDGVGPYRYFVIAEGWDAGSCGDCSPLNGIFEVPFNPAFGFVACKWTYTDTVNLCGTNYGRTVEVEIQDPGFAVVLTVTYTVAGMTATMQKFLDRPTDCLNLDESGAPTFSGSLCSGPTNIRVASSL